MHDKPLLIIVGVGLLGSSLGLAAKKRGLVDSVIGIGRRRETLDIALKRGAIGVAATDFEILRGIENGLAIVCTPVRKIVDNVRRIAEINAEILISDVGSTKAEICKELSVSKCRFIGAHPIAGSEKSGPEFGDPDLFQDRLTVLTPYLLSRAEDIKRLRFFWEAVGSRVVFMEPEEHDRTLARTSHLPHAIAATLASLLTDTERPFTGTGFADTTRIAAGPPEVWTDIFLENRRPLLNALTDFAEQLDKLRTALQQNNADAVARFITEAHDKRCATEKNDH